MSDGKRLLIISPVRNEAAHIRLLAESLERQRRPPDLWLAIDDESEDGTPDLLAELEDRIDWMRALSMPAGYTRDQGDRHAVAAAPRAFNRALRAVGRGSFTHIGKLDGDIELPDDYFSALLSEFDRNPRLGIGGGVLIERSGLSWQRARSAREHVRGALKLYSSACFEAIGGLSERLGWDGIDETYARMRGYQTESFDHIVARHHRPLGSADGSLRGKVRRGQVHYVLGYGPLWATLKSLDLVLLDREPVGGAAFLRGYLGAAWRAAPRVEDDEYRSFMRREQRRRLRAALRPWPSR